jgi:hypothetical protein
MVFAHVICKWSENFRLRRYLTDHCSRAEQKDRQEVSHAGHVSYFPGMVEPATDLVRLDLVV